MNSKTDYDFVTVYTIQVSKEDYTGFWKHYLDEVEASQEFWKALRDNYTSVQIKKERVLKTDLTVEIRAKTAKLQSAKVPEAITI